MGILGKYFLKACRIPIKMAVHCCLEPQRSYANIYLVKKRVQKRSFNWKAKRFCLITIALSNSLILGGGSVLDDYNVNSKNMATDISQLNLTQENIKEKWKKEKWNTTCSKNRVNSTSRNKATVTCG